MLQKKNTKIFALALTAVMLALVFAPFSPSDVGIYRGVGVCAFNRLTYHFFHAGLLHWFLNAWCFLGCVFLFRTSFRHVVAAFVIAASAPALSALPTIGFSGVCFALLGILSWQSASRVSYHCAIVSTILLACLLFPAAVNNVLHAYCYALGVLVGLAELYIIRKGGGDNG